MEYKMKILKFIKAIYNGKTSRINTSVRKIDMALIHIKEELEKSDNQQSPKLHELITVLRKEVLLLHELLSVEQQIDWDLVNSIKVETHKGDEQHLVLFLNKLYKERVYFSELIGVDILSA